jgi:PAN domain-containing protein
MDRSWSMFASPPKADIHCHTRHVRFGPQADIPTLVRSVRYATSLYFEARYRAQYCSGDDPIGAGQMAIDIERREFIALRRLSAALLALLVPASSAAADIIRWQDMYGGIVMNQTQCAAIPQAVWVSPNGRSFCMRYYLSNAGGQSERPVVFLGGDAPWASMADQEKAPPPEAHFNDSNTDSLVQSADRISRDQETTAILLARLGLDGSSGTHHSLRHTMLELLATNAALDAIKGRYGFAGFNVYGHSGGGNLAAGLLELRNDIACDVIADGQLTHPNPHGIKIETGKSANPEFEVFDVTDAVTIIARNRSARILVVTDPQDQIVRIEHQSPFVEKLKQAGGNIDQFFVDSGGPEHHFTAAHAAVVMRDCIRGASHDMITADLADFVAKRLATAARAEANAGINMPAAPAPSVGTPANGVDLHGADYSNFWAASTEPKLCQDACRSDAKCAAWTYVNPGVQGPQPRCWLKSQVPQATKNECCTSGIERVGSDTGKAN